MFRLSIYSFFFINSIPKLGKNFTVFLVVLRFFSNIKACFIGKMDMKISLLQKGDPNFNLYLIPGLNSGNDLSDWKVKKLGFIGNIHGLKWDNYLKDWDLFKSDLPEDIFKKIDIFNFIKEYNEVCLNADAAGKYLARNINNDNKKHNYILAHSMGTRAAFNYLHYCDEDNKTNQLLLFNGAVSTSEKLHNFKSYRNNALPGIFNFYNPNDRVLNVLPLMKDLVIDMFKIPIDYITSIDIVKEKTENLKKKLLKSDLVKKGIELIKELNSLYNFDQISNFFEPIGICDSKTIPENISINKIQGNEHSIDNILVKLIIFDDKNKRFKPLINFNK
jgi:hypothetical protein